MILKLFVKHTHVKLCIQACATNVIFHVYNKVYIYLCQFFGCLPSTKLEQHHYGRVTTDSTLSAIGSTI